MGAFHDAVRKAAIADATAALNEMNGIAISHLDTGVASPDTDSSPGAELLCDVRDCVVHAFTQSRELDIDSDRNDSEAIFRIVSEAPSGHIGTLWSQAGDLESYHEDVSETGGSTLLDMVTGAVSAQCVRVGHALAASFRETYESALECGECCGSLADTDLHDDAGNCTTDTE